MSEVVPLPSFGEVFFDARGQERVLRVTWHDGTLVFSLWRGEMCTASFRMPFADVGRLLETLQIGFAEAGRSQGGGDEPYPGTGQYVRPGQGDLARGGAEPGTGPQPGAERAEAERPLPSVGPNDVLVARGAPPVPEAPSPAAPSPTDAVPRENLIVGDSLPYEPMPTGMQQAVYQLPGEAPGPPPGDPYGGAGRPADGSPGGAARPAASYRLPPRTGSSYGVSIASAYDMVARGGETQDPTATDPYGPASADRYGGSATGPQQPASPGSYGSPTVTDPYGFPSAADPLGLSSSGYGASPHQTDPYGRTIADSYGGGPSGYGQDGRGESYSSDPYQGRTYGSDLPGGRQVDPADPLGLGPSPRQQSGWSGRPDPGRPYLNDPPRYTTGEYPAAGERPHPDHRRPEDDRHGWP